MAFGVDTRTRLRLQRLEALARRQAQHIHELASTLLRHVRTDLPPDAALPKARRLVEKTARHRR